MLAVPDPDPGFEPEPSPGVGTAEGAAEGAAEGIAGVAGVVGTAGASPEPPPALRVMVRRVLEGATGGLLTTLVGATGASVASAGSETVMKTPPGLEGGVGELVFTTEVG